MIKGEIKKEEISGKPIALPSQQNQLKVFKELHNVCNSPLAVSF
jgi:hypothetical protein